ncbi:hypothetical protein WKH56_20475 [Priestia sp. SB1]|uniref:hypothetical protein n=1 Tax=Priestia sp. SB1 TaxID=3132359 RepID=UPI0031711B0D
MEYFKSERLINTYGEDACRNAWDNAVRVGLRQKIWSKMWKEIDRVEGDSYLKSVEFITLKDTEYASKGEKVRYTSPAPSCFHIGRGVHKSTTEMADLIELGEIYPKLLISSYKDCENTLELFKMNETDVSLLDGYIKGN